MFSLARTARNVPVLHFTRAFATGAGSSQKAAQQAPSNPQAPSTPSGPLDDDKYTYLPPGCSLKEPMYVSLGDPVYHYDPSPSAVNPSSSASGTKSSSS